MADLWLLVTFEIVVVVLPTYLIVTRLRRTSDYLTRHRQAHWLLATYVIICLTLFTVLARYNSGYTGMGLHFGA
jgi:hypothetical protein